LKNDLSVVDIDPKPLTGFYFGPVIPGIFSWVADVNLTSLNGNGFFATSSAGTSDIAKALYGFGDESTTFVYAGARTGTNHFATPRDTHFDGSNSSAFNAFRYGQIIRGWKYGVYSGLPAYSKAYFRQKSYGQFRDMLEQRPMTAYHTGKTKIASPVSVKFVDATGKITNPENTWSQNLSLEATSSVPYLDGVARNRPSISIKALNAGVTMISANQFGQITL